MTDEQVGKYIRLLCLQHQKEYLTEKDMLNICKTYDEDIYRKFEKTDEGKYYNIRLKDEAERRKKYSESRAANRKILNTYLDERINNICLTCVNHMETETETVNTICSKCFNKKKYKKIPVEKKKFIPPTLNEVKTYTKEKGYTEDIAVRAFEFYDVNNWIDSHGNQVLNWKQKLLQVWFKPEHKIPFVKKQVTV